MKAKKYREDFDYKAFGRRLRSARLALGLSEEEAAAAAGRTVKTWLKYESTGCGYITEAILRFVDKHRVNLDWLFAGDGPPRLRSDPHDPPPLPWLNTNDLTRKELGEFVAHTPRGMLPVVVEGGWFMYLKERYREEFESLNRIRVLPRLVG